MRSIVVTLALFTGLSSAWAQQHSQKDAARLSSKLDEILRNADHPKHAAHPRKSAVKEPSKESAKDASVYQPMTIDRSDAATGGGSLGDVIVHAMRIAFDPDEWAVHLRDLPRTPDEVAVHLRNLPRTPDEVAAHLRNLPTTPDEIAAHLRNLPTTPDEFAAHLANLPRSPADVDAHLRRLDAALRHPRH